MNVSVKSINSGNPMTERQLQEARGHMSQASLDAEQSSNLQESGALKTTLTLTLTLPVSLFIISIIRNKKI